LRLLLHTCCAPCAIHSAKEAGKNNFTVTGFFYNPNIQPSGEYKKRKEETESYFRSESLELVSGGYDRDEFFRRMGDCYAPPGRCLLCWSARLERTARFAKEKNFDAFTTTLLASPYQDHESIKDIGAKLSEEKGIKFYYSDFRKGFKEAHTLAKKKGIYCQNYCGCVFSLVEREEKRR